MFKKAKMRGLYDQSNLFDCLGDDEGILQTEKPKFVSYKPHDSLLSNLVRFPSDSEVMYKKLLATCRSYWTFISRLPRGEIESLLSVQPSNYQESLVIAGFVDHFEDLKANFLGSFKVGAKRMFRALTGKEILCSTMREYYISETSEMTDKILARLLQAVVYYRDSLDFSQNVHPNHLKTIIGLITGDYK